MSDPWEVFGSDDEKSQEGKGDDVSEISNCLQNLTQHWMRRNASVRLSQRRLGFHGTKDAEVWKKEVFDRGIRVESDSSSQRSMSGGPVYDAVVWLLDEDEDVAKKDEDLKVLFQLTSPGGCLILPTGLRNEMFQKEPHHLWTSVSSLSEVGDPVWTLMERRVCSIQWKTCRWLPEHYDIAAEYDRVSQATVALTVEEHEKGKMTEQSIQKGVKALQQHGYCIVAGGLLDQAESQRYGQAALEDFHAAARILRETDGVDLYHPGDAGGNEAGAYRELSLREDYRLDLRHGPALQKIRGDAGSKPRILTAPEEPPGEFLRCNTDLLEITRRVMNPVNEKLSPGNVGRYNFSGRGPDGSFQDLRMSPVGSIISFPGSADQALHADTPHLFEHLELLPAHYINIFTPGIATRHDDDEGGVVGQTALLHDTHQLHITARYWEKKTELWKQHLVRPRLQMGDVLLFDCRILHFGIGNEAKDGTERPVLYTNTTMHWFEDPKNWDNERYIFKSMLPKSNAD